MNKYKKLLIIILKYPAIIISIASCYSNKSWGGIVRDSRVTYPLKRDQFTVEIEKFHPFAVYVIYSYGEDQDISEKAKKNFFREDTLVNLKGLPDSIKKGIVGYRLIFQSGKIIDSVLELGSNMINVYLRGININNSILKIIEYDRNNRQLDRFLFDFTKVENSLSLLLRRGDIYYWNERKAYSVGSVWLLSIGINKYDDERLDLSYAKTDALSYSSYFKTQYDNLLNFQTDSSIVHKYALTDTLATKERIINCLKEIANRALPEDYFIFTFNGHVILFTTDSLKSDMYFLPWNAGHLLYDDSVYQQTHLPTPALLWNFISLKQIEEYIQLIPATNQLFVADVGKFEKFKSEFIKGIIQHSASAANLVNKNRIIITPTKGEYETSSLQKSILNYCITSLDSSSNIFNLFNKQKATQVVYKLNVVEYTIHDILKNFLEDDNYLDVFFERQFLQLYKDIFGDENQQTRGLPPTENPDLENATKELTGKHYALIVGTDNYKGSCWHHLNNPVSDVRAVASELENSYGFEVKLLENSPMDTIYKAIRDYYLIAKPNDQLIVYFAGHGDIDNELLSDGFVVCSDSKSIEDDPMRNTYIPYTKLQKIINNIPARQILVMLDVCHGGAFDSKVFTSEKRENTIANISNRNIVQFLKDKLPLRTRKILSSVGIDAAFDGEAGSHSPFANLLLQVLRAKGGASNGILTLSDIDAVLQTASLNETASLRISPHMADFGTVDAFSEFVLIPTNKTVAK